MVPQDHTLLKTFNKLARVRGEEIIFHAYSVFRIYVHTSIYMYMYMCSLSHICTMHLIVIGMKHRMCLPSKPLFMNA